MTNNRLIKRAKEADLHAGNYAFAGRKMKKRDMRRLWILRINEALKKRNLTYSRFIKALSEENILLNRKILALLASKQPEVFDKVIEKVQNKS